MDIEIVERAGASGVASCSSSSSSSGGSSPRRRSERAFRRLAAFSRSSSRAASRSRISLAARFFAAAPRTDLCCADVLVFGEMEASGERGWEERGVDEESEVRRRFVDSICLQSGWISEKSFHSG